MKTLDEYFAEVAADPNYTYAKAVGDAGVDLLAATYGIEAVVENLKQAEDAHALHVGYYNDVVLPAIAHGSTNTTRVFSSDSFGETNVIPSGTEAAFAALEEAVVVDNIFLARVASRLRDIADSPHEISDLADILENITEKVEENLVGDLGPARYNELYLSALARAS